MPTEVPLRCRCGTVRGIAVEVSPSTTNRLVCYCTDCQAFARFLDRADVVDSLGGTDILHMAPARLRITDGLASVRSMRLSSKGLLRWYADCCKTPIANTISAKVQFAGIVTPILDLDAAGRDAALGEPHSYIHGNEAIGGLPAHAHPKASARTLFRIVRRLVGWRLAGKGSPSPFFDTKTGAPIIEPRVLSVAERDALRP